MTKVTDFIADYLASIGVRHVFMLTGGGAMHLNDSFGKHPQIEVVCNNHEQACAIAAEGYARTGERLAVVNVTTGPGGLNTLTGVMGQWTDSVPVLYISGQVRFDTTVYAYPHIGLRQLGDQEVPIVDIVRPITKFASVVQDARSIKWLLQKAVYLATHGRPGPVWLDVPMNVQGSMVEESSLNSWNCDESMSARQDILSAEVRRCIEMFHESERPAVVCGHGVRIAKAQRLAKELWERLGIPVLTTFNGIDLVESSHPSFIGRIGTIGNRAGNFVLQNADLLLILGSRNNIRQVSYAWDLFGRSAKKIIVDMDAAELTKPTVKGDLCVHADAGTFLRELLSAVAEMDMPNWEPWLAWGQERKRCLPTVSKSNTSDDGPVDAYWFCRVLSEELPPDSVVVIGNATPSIAYFQSGQIQSGQRVLWNSGCASMGYDLPASIGACLARSKRQVVCLAGDGSLQLNIQELATVVHYGLPIKLFYFDNDGYISIRQTQDNYFEGRKIGVDRKTGVGIPDIAGIAQAYGLATREILSHPAMRDQISAILREPGPLLCRVALSNDYVFAPKLSSEKKPDGRMISKPLEDMFPFLDRAQFRSNMIVDPIDE